MTQQERIQKIQEITNSAMIPSEKLLALQDFVDTEKKAEQSSESDASNTEDTLETPENSTDLQKVQITNKPSDIASAFWEMLRGNEGQEGKQGEKGQQGDKGEQGIPGIKGDKGDTGQNGADGNDGQDGTNGTDGADGEKGEDGQSLDIQTVVKAAVKELKKKQEKIHVKNITGLDALRDEIVNHAVTQARGLLYAGLLSGSTTTSGGGLTPITITGTVNGSNKVFTSTLPTYVVSDGVWNKAVDRIGVTNWTWVAGTLTMTVPPTSDIYGF